MPSHLLHESAMIRDQVCSSSNKGGCLLTHTLAICKPDPLAYTGHLHLKTFYEHHRPVVSEQSENKNNGACTPSGENWVRSV